MIQIDKGVPLPPDYDFGCRNGKGYKYPFHRLEVGDSFLWPKESNRHSVYSLTCWASKRFEKKFITRNTPEGYRCWRVE